MRKSLDFLASPYAISPWSWGITLIVALVNSPQLSKQSEVAILPWILAVLILHVFLAPVLVICKRVLGSLKIHGSRIFFALITFACFGVIRSAALAGYAASRNQRDFLELLSMTVVSYISVSMIVLTAVAYVYVGTKQHEMVMRRLNSLNQSLQDARSATENDSLLLRNQLVEEAKESIKIGLERLGKTVPSNSMEISAQLREISEKVIRPLSHDYLFKGPDDSQSISINTEISPRISLLDDLLSKAKPGSPSLAPITLEALITPFLVAQYGLQIAILNLLISTPCLISGNYLLSKLWPKDGIKRKSEAIVLALGYWLLGGISAVPIFLLSKIMYLNFPLYWASSFFYLMICLLFIIDRATKERRADLEKQITQTLASQAVEISKVRAEALKVRSELGRFLHSKIQADLVAMAASRSISKKFLSENMTLVPGDSVTQSLNSFFDGEILGDARTEFYELIELWSGALTIAVDVETSLWYSIEWSDSRKTLLIEIVAEGLTNAVKHSSGKSVDIKLRENKGNLEIRIISQGRISQSSKPGGGYALLKNSSSHTTLEEIEGKVHLVSRLR